MGLYLLFLNRSWSPRGTGASHFHPTAAVGVVKNWAKQSADLGTCAWSLHGEGDSWGWNPCLSRTQVLWTVKLLTCVVINVEKWIVLIVSQKSTTIAGSEKLTEHRLDNNKMLLISPPLQHFNYQHHNKITDKAAMPDSKGRLGWSMIFQLSKGLRSIEPNFVFSEPWLLVEEGACAMPASAWAFPQSLLVTWRAVH